MNWIYTETGQRPGPEDDCLVLFTIGESEEPCLRAPANWDPVKEQWTDEWGNVLDVIRYVVISLWT